MTKVMIAQMVLTNDQMMILNTGPDPMDKQRIAKAVRFDTPEEIQLWGQFVALNKSKSQRDNPLNQHLIMTSIETKLKKILRNLQALKIKSKTAKKLRKKRIQQQQTSQSCKLEKKCILSF